MLFCKRTSIPGITIFDLAYGIVNTTSLGSRKASDRIDFFIQVRLCSCKALECCCLAEPFAHSLQKVMPIQKRQPEKIPQVWFQISSRLAYMLYHWVLTINQRQLLRFHFANYRPLCICNWWYPCPKIRAWFRQNVKSEFGAFLSANYMKKIGEKIQKLSKQGSTSSQIIKEPTEYRCILVECADSLHHQTH